MAGEAKMMQIRPGVSDMAHGGLHASNKIRAGSEKMSPRSKSGSDKDDANRTLSREQKVKFLMALLKKRGDHAASEMRKRIQENSNIVAKGNSFGVDVMAEVLQIYNEERVMQRPAPVATPDAARRRPAPATLDAQQKPSTSAAAEGGSGARNTSPAPQADPASEISKAPTPYKRLLKRKCPSPVQEPEGGLFNAGVPLEKAARRSLQAHVGSSEHTEKVDSTPHLNQLRGSADSPQTGPKSLQAPFATPAVSSKAHASEMRMPEVHNLMRTPEVHTRSTREAVAGKAQEFLHRGSVSPSVASPVCKPSMAQTLPPQSVPHRETPDRETPEPHPEPCPTASPAASTAPSTARTASSTAPSSGTSACDFSVKELKGFLTENRIDFRRCVEKADLQALWSRFETLRQRPLQELRDSCAARGVRPVPHNAQECAARLLAEDTAPAQAASGAGAGAASVPASAPGVQAPAAEAAGLRGSSSTSSLGGGDGGPSPDVANREAEAKREVNRIASLRRETYHSAAAWGFAVLAVTTKDLASVQRGYRGLMKKLHPDKVQHTGPVSKAVEACREAKEACERGLSRQEVPGQPRALSYTAECATPGQRQFRLHWQPPTSRECAPVRRYIVAAFDPAYGKALTVAVLEPDYNEELRRFVSVDELDSYVLSERELVKMPLLWKQPTATVQVAAANEAGQSSWSTLQVALNCRPAAPVNGKGLTYFMSQLGSGNGFGSNASPSPEVREAKSFEQELHARRLYGLDILKPWLEKQRKPVLQQWLQSNECPAEGTKEILVERVLWVLSKRWRS